MILKLQLYSDRRVAKVMRKIRKTSVILIIVILFISANMSCFNSKKQINKKNGPEILHDYDIVFLSNREESRSDIYVIDTLTQQKTNITDNLINDRYAYPTFLNNDKITFFNNDRKKLFLADLNKRKTTLILESKEPIIEYDNYCIDRKREEILISEKNGMITFIDLNSGKKRSINSEIGQFKYPTFSPDNDNKLIAVVGKEKQDIQMGNIYLITPEGKKVSQLTNFTATNSQKSSYQSLSWILSYPISWSYNGRKILLSIVSAPKIRDLAIIDITTKKLTRITHTTQPATDINNFNYGYLYGYWSPDNKYISSFANFSDYTWSKYRDCIVMNSNETNIFNLSKKYPQFKGLDKLYWSKDSKRIAFPVIEGKNEIKLVSMNPDGTNIIENDLSFRGSGNEWSSDGRKFVYPENSPLGHQVFITSTRGVEAKNISNGLVVGGDYPDLRGYGFPSPWTKDGSKIGIQIYHPDRIDELDNYRIFIIEKDGDTFEITNIRDDLPWNPCWSPYGKEILYECETGKAKGEDVYITDLKGNKRILKKSRELAGFAAGEQYVFWLENGKICYYAKPSPEKDYQNPDNKNKKNVAVMDIFLINPDGSGEVNLTKDLYITSFPHWNYDHTKFIFTDINEKDKVQIFNVKKKRVSLTVDYFANFQSINTSFCWSYDNNTFFATRNDEISNKIVALNTNNGKIKEILSIPISQSKKISDLACSPNKRYISFISSDIYKLEKGEQIIKEIYIYDIIEKKIKKLTNTPLPNESYSKYIKNNYGNFNPQFTPDSSKIVYESNRDGNNEIYVINIDGTRLTNLSNSPANDVFPRICSVPSK